MFVDAEDTVVFYDAVEDASLLPADDDEQQTREEDSTIEELRSKRAAIQRRKINLRNKKV